jgi:hypothetical protein
LLAAGLLRKLLLDESPLVHQVNRYRRAQIRFHTNGETPLERITLERNPVFWAIEDAINPDAFPFPGSSAPTDAKLDQFLARTEMYARGERLSVGALIKQVAYVDGAVHKGRPINASEELLDEMSRFMFSAVSPGQFIMFSSPGRSSYEHSLRSATRSWPTKV